MGLTLVPGDPVAYRGVGAEIGIRATVLRVLPSGECLIQLDAESIHRARELGDLVGQLDLLDRVDHEHGQGLQDVLEVQPNTLTALSGGPRVNPILEDPRQEV
jgi:hypothetical protein